MSGSEVEMCQLIELELGAARGKAEVEGWKEMPKTYELHYVPQLDTVLSVGD